MEMYDVLIHSVDPQSLLVVIIVFAQVVHPYVPTFQNIAQTKQIQAKTMFATGETMGLAKWIIILK